jgi:hypothetical protein
VSRERRACAASSVSYLFSRWPYPATTALLCCHSQLRTFHSHSAPLPAIISSQRYVNLLPTVFDLSSQNAPPTPQVKALGWSISQTCATLIDHSPSNIKVGDVGTVIGPGTSSGDDAAQRVLVDFGAGKGKLNVLAKTQIITLEEKAKREAAEKASAEKAAKEQAAAEKAAKEKAAAAEKAAKEKARREAAEKAAAEKAAAEKAAKETMRERATALGLLSVLESVNLDSDETIAAGVKFCDDKGAQSANDIVEFAHLDMFIKALQLKSIPGMRLKGALQPTNMMASQLSHRGERPASSRPQEPKTPGWMEPMFACGGEASTYTQLSARPIDPQLLREGAPAVTLKQSNDLQQSLHAHLGSRSWSEWWPQVCISYATGTRPGVDARGAGPGMLQAAAIMQALHGAAIPCASGLHVPPGSNWKDFLPKIDSRFSRCEVLIVLLSTAFFRSQPCLLEVHKATQAKRMKIIPLRCEEPLPNKEEQWPEVGHDDARMLDEVQSELGPINALPARGLFFDDENHLKELVAQITKEISRGAQSNLRAGARHKN